MEELLLCKKKTFSPGLFPHILSTARLCNTPPYLSSHPAPLRPWPQTSPELPAWPQPDEDTLLLSPLALLVRPCPVLSTLGTRHLLIQVTHKQLAALTLKLFGIAEVCFHLLMKSCDKDMQGIRIKYPKENCMVCV